MGFGIEPHHFLSIARYSCCIADGVQDGKAGVFSLAQAERDANRSSDEYDLPFTSQQIHSTIRRSVVLAAITRRAFDEFVLANTPKRNCICSNGRTPTLQRWTSISRTRSTIPQICSTRERTELEDPRSVAPMRSTD